MSSAARSQSGLSASARSISVSAVASRSCRRAAPVLYAASATAKCASALVGIRLARARAPARRRACLSGCCANRRLSCRNDLADAAAGERRRRRAACSSRAFKSSSSRAVERVAAAAAGGERREDLLRAARPSGRARPQLRRLLRPGCAARARSAISVARRASRGSRASRAASKYARAASARLAALQRDVAEQQPVEEVGGQPVVGRRAGVAAPAQRAGDGVDCASAGAGETRRGGRARRRREATQTSVGRTSCDGRRRAAGDPVERSMVRL